MEIAASDATGQQAGDGLVSIVLLCANQLQYTRQCVDSILRHTGPPYELVVVDNASTDDTSVYLASLVNRPGPQRVCVLRNEVNRGFSAGCNQALAKAQGGFVLFLNNDTLVSAGWLDGLLDAFHKNLPRVGLVGPVSNSVAAPQQVPASYRDVPGFDGFAAHRRRDFAGQSQPVWRLTGLCLLARRTLFERIGGFDEDYGLGYFEDYDLCLRTERAGLILVLAPAVFIHHFGSQSFHGLGLDRKKHLAVAYHHFFKKWGAEAPARYAPEFIPVPPEVEACLPAWAKHVIGRTFAAHGQPSEAERLLRAAATMESQSSRAWLDLGNLLLEQQRWQEVEQVRDALDRLPDGSAGSRSLYVRSLLAQGRPGDARGLLEEQFAHTPNDVDCQVMLGRLLVQEALERLQHAEVLLRDGFAKAPGRPDAKECLQTLEHLRSKDAQSGVSLDRLYWAACTQPSDINEHCPRLYRLGKECQHITEMGTRSGVSTTAFLYAQPKKLVCYDLLFLPEIKQLKGVANKTTLVFCQGDVLRADIEETDLLFIDTWHVYEQLQQELALHAARVKRYIVLHDTTTFGEHGESPDHAGIWKAVEEFLEIGSFNLLHRFHNNNGLTVLARRSDQTLGHGGF